MGQRRDWPTRYMVFSVSPNAFRAAAHRSEAHVTVREEAHELYKAAPSFSYWDPAVLDTFIRYGITEDKNHPPSGVKLKGPVILVRLETLSTSRKLYSLSRLTHRKPWPFRNDRTVLISMKCCQQLTPRLRCTLFIAPKMPRRMLYCATVYYTRP